MSYNHHTHELVNPYETLGDLTDGVYVDHRRKESTVASFPSVERLDDLQWPITDPRTTNLRFVYWAHVAENAQSLVSATAGSDVIAFENVAVVPDGESEADEEFRYVLGRAIENKLTGAQLLPHEDYAIRQLPEETKDSIRDHDLVKEILYSSDDVYDPLLSSLIDSGVRIEYLDLKPRHSDSYRDFETKKEQALDRLSGAILSGKCFAEIAGLVLDRCEAQADLLGFRDAIATDQITRLADEYRGSNVSVVYGSEHLLLSRMVADSGTTAQRVFVEDLQDKSEKIRYISLSFAIEAALRSGGRSAVDAEHLCSLTADSIVIRVFGKNVASSIFLSSNSQERADAEQEIVSLWENETPQDGSRKAKKELSNRIRQTKKIVKLLSS